MKLTLLSCLALFYAFNLHAQNEITDKATGETFPSTVSFDYQGKNYQLDATGVSTRKKLVFKVYSAAHYLQKDAAKGKDLLQEILNDANAKQLTIKWTRDVPLDKVHEGYEESFKTAISDPSKFQNEIKTYIGFFTQNVKKGDEHVIRWIPGGIIEVQVDGKAAGTITNPEFAKGVWNIWFGPHSVVNRDQLLSIK